MEMLLSQGHPVIPGMGNAAAYQPGYDARSCSSFNPRQERLLFDRCPKTISEQAGDAMNTSCAGLATLFAM
eukprot:10818226-Karenia_brevis.AAC.1